MITKNYFAVAVFINGKPTVCMYYKYQNKYIAKFLWEHKYIVSINTKHSMEHLFDVLNNLSFDVLSATHIKTQQPENFTSPDAVMTVK